MGPLFLLYEAFLWPLLTYASSGWFPFLSITNITKLECLHQATSRAISGCLLSSPIPFLLSETSLPPLRVTLTHFALSSYEWALHLLTSFPVSGLTKMWLLLTLSHLTLWCSGQTALFLFLLAKMALAYLPSALSAALRPLFLFSRPSMFKVFC